MYLCPELSPSAWVPFRPAFQAEGVDERGTFLFLVATAAGQCTTILQAAVASPASPGVPIFIEVKGVSP